MIERELSTLSAFLQCTQACRLQSLACVCVNTHYDILKGTLAALPPHIPPSLLALYQPGCNSLPAFCRKVASSSPLEDPEMSPRLFLFYRECHRSWSWQREGRGELNLTLCGG